MPTAILSPTSEISHTQKQRLAEIDLGLELLGELIKIRTRQLDKESINEQELATLQQRIAKLSILDDHDLSYAETVTLLLAIAPNVQPALLDQAFMGSLESAGDYPEIGGLRGKYFRGFLPTIQTVLFLLDTQSLSGRVEHMKMFADDHIFAGEDLLTVREQGSNEPTVSSQLDVNEDFLTYLMTGVPASPRFSMNFPAQRLTTERDWDDLVLSDDTRAGIEHIKLWLEHRDRVLNDWGMSRMFRPSYTCLFFGPPGTGKTLTASLFGKLGYPVYRIDLAMVVSKFIGETEKNLERVFRRAERKNWILFFDEADALFSKRTGVRDAHDKYANQEVAYLLQRIEQFSGSGLVILASNLKGNIDTAFLRRFQSVIYFPRPEAKDRLEIWKKMVPDGVYTDKNVELEDVFRKYELSGGSIVNILQFCLIRVAARKSDIIKRDDILAAVVTEYRKEGRTA